MCRTRWLAVALALATLAAQPGRAETATPTAPAAPIATGATAATAASPVQVEIRGFKFEPERLQVRVGTTVTWINRDSEPHTVTSLDQRFQSSGALDTDDHYTQTFSQPGSYAYICSVHPFMRASVVVVPAK